MHQFVWNMSRRFEHVFGKFWVLELGPVFYDAIHIRAVGVHHQRQFLQRPCTAIDGLYTFAHLDHWRFETARMCRLTYVNGHHFERIKWQACHFTPLHIQRRRTPYLLPSGGRVGVFFTKFESSKNVQWCKDGWTNLFIDCTVDGM